MKICAAQTRPVRGNIEANIRRHQELIKLATAQGAELIIFPELSVTGYEPELAQELAMIAEDNRFNILQEMSDVGQVTIGVGAPVKNDKGICISMLIFEPGQVRKVYSKKYLHADEEPFFVCGQETVKLAVAPTIAIAICYELSVPQHADDAFKNGAEMYMTSVAKTASGVEKATQRLSEIASQYAMTVIMANCVGMSGDGECTGNTAAWNNKGVLIGQLDNHSEGILLVDTLTSETIIKMS